MFKLRLFCCTMCYYIMYKLWRVSTGKLCNCLAPWTTWQSHWPAADSGAFNISQAGADGLGDCGVMEGHRFVIEEPRAVNTGSLLFTENNTCKWVYTQAAFYCKMLKVLPCFLCLTHFPKCCDLFDVSIWMFSSAIWQWLVSRGHL